MIKEISLKKILLLLCVGLLIFGVTTAYAAQDWDKIIAKAKEEGVVVTYGTSSRLARVSSIMKELYGIEIKHAKMSDQEITERIIRETEAGLNEVDFIMAEDIVGTGMRLLPNGYVKNFVPSTVEDVIAEDYKDPFVFLVQPRVIVYNSEVYDECPISNLWELTTEKWKGKFILRDPEITSTNVSFFAEIIAKADLMADAYKECFGREIELTTPNAGWEFIKRLVKNDIVTTSSDSDVAEAVGTPGQKNPPLGFSTVGKLRMNESDGYVLAVAEDINPTIGYHYPAYGLQVTNAPHPNAAKLLARVLMTDEGAHAWTQDPGNFSTNPNNSSSPKNPLGGLNDWRDATWSLNMKTSVKYSRDVIDFWIMERE